MIIACESGFSQNPATCHHDGMEIANTLSTIMQRRNNLSSPSLPQRLVQGQSPCSVLPDSALTHRSQFSKRVGKGESQVRSHPDDLAAPIRPDEYSVQKPPMPSILFT